VAYISHIGTAELRGIPPLRISLTPAPGKAFRHLVLTGPNGTGKTSLVGAIAAQIFADVFVGGSVTTKGIRTYALQSVQEDLGSSLELGGDDRRKMVRELPFGHVTLEWEPPLDESGHETRRRGTFAYLPARRGIEMHAVSTISAEDDVRRKSAFEAETPQFLQFLVNRKAQQSFARDDGDDVTAMQLEQWFGNLDASLARLFDEDGLHLEFERKTLTFYLVSGAQRTSLLELAHGHAAALGILAEVIMRVDREMDGQRTPDQGIVLIDEPEMHLHLELQERILPALVEMFPRIQLIVATHSPAVVSSIDDAIVFDLEERRPRSSEDLRGRPYGWIMKRQFGLEEDSARWTDPLGSWAESPRGPAEPSD